MIEKIKIFTDGACLGNPGPGGWGALICYQGKKEEISGAEFNTTNNRMELTAAIKALNKALELAPNSIDITTDSEYLRQGITQWIFNWKQRGWKTNQNRSVKNIDLWQKLDEIVTEYEKIEWHWVRSHNGHPENERADFIARNAIKKTHPENVDRQVVFDTETTGLKPEEGHRVIEIGCIELINRRKTGSTFHRYINPGREIDAEAIKIHGLTNEFLVNQPSFSEIADDFVSFICGSELIAHNASFDIGFLNSELKRVNIEWEGISSYCTVIDTLRLARQRHPGQKNNLDSLCKRYGIDNTHRELHGALLDSELLAEVYLAMTRGQEGLKFGITQSSYDHQKEQPHQEEIHRISTDRARLKVLEPNEEEKLAHKQWLVNHSTFSW